METLLNAIRSHGLEPPVVLKPGVNRFPGAGKSNGNTAGWCHVFDDGLGAVFGDWSNNLHETWQAKREKPFTPAERDAFQRHVAEAKTQVEADKKTKQAEAAIKATEIWDAALPAPAGHHYLTKKNIEPHGARLHNGDLVIPLRIGGTIHNLQFISPSGDKKFLYGGRVTGCYFTIAKADGRRRCCVLQKVLQLAQLSMKQLAFPWRSHSPAEIFCPWRRLCAENSLTWR